MPRLCNLDIDGVLADEAAFLKALPPASKLALSHTQAFYSERAPLWVPEPGSDPANLLQGWSVRIVSKRPRWVEATTIIWLQYHYPWLLKALSSIVHVGPEGSKVAGLSTPDLAIDDSFNAIREYRQHSIPVFGVRTEANSWCPANAEFTDVPFLPRVDDALRLMGVIFK